MGNNIAKLRKQRGWTQDEFGERIGVTKSAVSLYESGRRAINSETLSKMAEVFGVSVDTILGGVDDAELFGRQIVIRPELVGEDEVMIPVVATLRCGFGRSGEAVYKDQRPVPSSYLKRWGDKIVFYEAVGESMSPTITPGDLLVTVPGPAWEDGWIVVVDVNDSDTIKRIYRSKEDGGVDLVPDNKKYKPMHLSPAELAEYNVAVLGHVVKPIGPDL